MMKGSLGYSRRRKRCATQTKERAHGGYYEAGTGKSRAGELLRRSYRPVRLLDGLGN